MRLNNILEINNCIFFESLGFAMLGRGAKDALRLSSWRPVATMNKSGFTFEGGVK